MPGLGSNTSLRYLDFCPEAAVTCTPKACTIGYQTQQASCWAVQPVLRSQRPEARGNSREEDTAPPVQERWPAEGGKESMTSSYLYCLPAASKDREDGAALPTSRGAARR